ncbi:S-layer homology domain-containing protein [Ureibacillus sinduriensis]|uniref:SLH domain-containing protein n=1 Tax=Ureibacillus sinduriensis BLB-1 = JCM 15800 TaxID=1384057 RepID=A0A0A3HQB5_9BACL|nr:S-layer homology domain-containing protein [Ureibacillus sinduriensis]KGR74761.1 hypothetical protein CD33_13350 [Ureibacillus sinduriensis BLB-1 = JCM 15800]
MKAISIFLTSFVLFGFSVSPALAEEKSTELYFLDDVEYEHWAYNELERFLYADIIDGYVEMETYVEDGEEYEYPFIYIKPDDTITRAEFTKILVNAMNLDAMDTSKSFPDVKQSNWYYDYVRAASSHGIINGKTDGTFRPNAKITRDEITAMIYRAFQTSIDFSKTGQVFPDVPKGNFAYEAIMRTAAAGIIKGYGDAFKPYNNATRAEAITMIDRALHLEQGTEEDLISVAQIVDKNIKEEVKFSEQQDVESLEALYRETTIGYYLATSLESLYMEDEMNATYTMEQVGQHSIDPVTVNKNFAQARIDNLNYNLSMTSPEMSFNMTVNLSGTAFLKKNHDGHWKIYNIVLDEDETGEDWEE